MGDAIRSLQRSKHVQSSVIVAEPSEVDFVRYYLQRLKRFGQLRISTDFFHHFVDVLSVDESWGNVGLCEEQVTWSITSLHEFDRNQSLITNFK